MNAQKNKIAITGMKAFTVNVYTVFIGLFLISGNVTAQPVLSSSQQEPLSKIATIKVPSSVELSKQEAGDFVTSHFKHFRFLSSGYKRVYASGNVLLGFEDFTLPGGSNLDLARYERELVGEIEEAESMKLTQSSYQITFNDTRFVVRKVHRTNDNFLFFSSETRNSKGIRGTVQYRDADSTKALQLFDSLLKSIKLNQ